MPARTPVRSDSLRKTVTRETALFLGLLFLGLLILPIAVFMVGKSVFGEYGGNGFSAFYGNLHSAIRDREPAILFLVMSPYIIWQLLRLTVWGFRKTWRHRQGLRS